MSTPPRSHDDVPAAAQTHAKRLRRTNVLRAWPTRAVASLLTSWRDLLRHSDPTFGTGFVLAFAVTVVLFMRSPTSNFIFDEQEALLANPYLHDRSLSLAMAFERDFWGLPPDRTIGSYRPLPSIFWRLLSTISNSPWLLHWLNLVVHAINASLVARWALVVTGRRRLAWMAGAVFCTCAILTEAVSGVVGLADVLSGMGILLALHALRVKLGLVPLAAFGAALIAMFSKESGVLAVPLVVCAALTSSTVLHRRHPRLVVRAVLGLLGSAAAWVVYVELRRRLFPVGRTTDLIGSWGGSWQAAAGAFNDWIHQPRIPRDPINNPLVDADAPHRVAGALRVYAEGIVQVLFPHKLSGDYSYAQETVPAQLFGLASVLGAIALILPPLIAAAVWLRVSGWRPRPNAAHGSVALLVAFGLIWVPLAYFPHSNILVLLPTVRAERFWYVPAIGMAWLLGAGLDRLWPNGPGREGGSSFRVRWRRIAVILLFGVQAVAARLHALAYTNDLWFWRMTRWASPNSAKAHLNYAVMLGARGHREARLTAGERALQIAPRWPMAHVYHADALCRLGRSDQAWPYYVRGWKLAPNDKNLVALGLQCLWDKGQFERRRTELQTLGDAHPDTWLEYLVVDVLRHGKDQGGVRPEDRPRAYDQGPKGASPDD